MALQRALEMEQGERADRTRRNLEYSQRLTTANWATQVSWGLHFFSSFLTDVDNDIAVCSSDVRLISYTQFVMYLFSYIFLRNLLGAERFERRGEVPGSRFFLRRWLRHELQNHGSKGMWMI